MAKMPFIFEVEKIPNTVRTYIVPNVDFDNSYTLNQQECRPFSAPIKAHTSVDLNCLSIERTGSPSHAPRLKGGSSTPSPSPPQTRPQKLGMRTYARACGPPPPTDLTAHKAKATARASSRLVWWAAAAPSVHWRRASTSLRAQYLGCARTNVDP